jgi:hypothetical protein
VYGGHTTSPPKGLRNKTQEDLVHWKPSSREQECWQEKKNAYMVMERLRCMLYELYWEGVKDQGEERKGQGRVMPNK